MRWFEKWMRTHAQFRARISHPHILLITTEMHLKFNTHANLHRTNWGPSKAYSVSLWSVSSEGHRRSWCYVSFIPVTTGSTTVTLVGPFQQPIFFLFLSTLFPFCLPRTTGICPGSSQPSVHGSTLTPSFHLSLGICPFSCHSKFFIPKMKQTPIRRPLSFVSEK